jgi:hypothetical protein
MWINRLAVLSRYLLSRGVDNTLLYYYHGVVGGETRVGVHYMQDAGGWIMNIFLALLRCLLKWLLIRVNWASEYTFG